MISAFYQHLRREGITELHISSTKYLCIYIYIYICAKNFLFQMMINKTNRNAKMAAFRPSWRRGKRFYDDGWKSEGRSERLSTIGHRKTIRADSPSRAHYVFAYGCPPRRAKK